MNLRILLASDYYPPFIGGAHRQTQLLGAELHKRGHTVNVATVWQPGLPEADDDDGVTVHRLRDLRTALYHRTHRNAGREQQQRHHPGYPDPVTVMGLRRIIADFRPDLIHSYGWFTFSVAAAVQDQAIPLLVTARDYAHGCTTRTLVYNGEQACSGPALSKCLRCATNLYGFPKGAVAVMGSGVGNALLRRKVTGVHSISTYVQEMVHRDFLFNSATELPEAIIPSFREKPVDECFSADPALQAYVAQFPKEPFILFVGALRKVKGVDQLLAAYRQLRNAPPLVLIGTREVDSPTDLPPNVHVLENFPNRAVMAAWEHARFGATPSLLPEPLGSVVYEGMSQGKAIIGTKPGGHTDMITHNQSGLLVHQGDVAGLAAAMQRLIDDPELCDRLGAAAKLQAHKYVADVSVPRFEQLYHKMVQQNSMLAQPTVSPLVGR